jgi:hypothetical protein
VTITALVAAIFRGRFELALHAVDRALAGAARRR